MKVILAGILVFSIALTFHSCKKSSSNNTPAADSSFMKATINGTSFSAAGVSQAYATGSSSGGINYLYINGLAANGKAIQITLIDVTTTGILMFATGSAAGYYYSSGGLFGPSTYATSGSINITSLSPSIKGTYNFTTADSTVITNGSFWVKAP